MLLKTLPMIFTSSPPGELDPTAAFLPIRFYQ
jgi:hypothetical protein